MLWLCLLPAALSAQDPVPASPDFPTLEREYLRARDTWTQRYREAAAAKDAKVQRKLLGERPEATFLPRFLAAAESFAGREEAVPFLAWIVQNGELEAARTAMTTLVDKHAASSAIRPAVARLGGLHPRLGLEPTRKWLDAVLAGNQDPGVQSQARFTRAALYVGTRAAAHSEPLRRLAIEDLRLVLDNPGTDSLQHLAKRLLAEAETREPGLPAPEIRGEDLDGVAFNLSDYRGKVILLDFWGDW